MSHSAFRRIGNNNFIIYRPNNTIWLDSIEKVIYNGFLCYQDSYDMTINLIIKYNFCPFVKLDKSRFDKESYRNLEQLIKNTPCEIFFIKYDYATFKHLINLSLRKYKKYYFILDFL